MLRFFIEKIEKIERRLRTAEHSFRGVRTTFPSRHLALRCTKQAPCRHAAMPPCLVFESPSRGSRGMCLVRSKLWERILQRPPLPLRLLHLFSCSASKHPRSARSIRSASSPLLVSSEVLAKFRPDWALQVVLQAASKTI